MAVVTFFEKPGCSGNARQKQLLEAAGHTVVPRDLFNVKWTRMDLLSFLSGLPVPQWFNRSAVAVKSGEIVPEELDAATALALLQADPKLIRRPLLEVDGDRRAGFNAAAIHAWIGLGQLPADDPEACRHEAGHQCKGHEGPEAHQCGCGGRGHQ